MSVREYIGARYIMKFADPINWDNTIVYEPLTVVQYNGASYISKQYVPEGANILNTDYWIRMADFDAQIEMYRQEVSQYSDAIETNASNIAQEILDRIEAIDDIEDALDDEANIRENADSNLQNSISTINSIIPSNSFSSVNTVKKAIDNVSNNLANLNVVANKDYAVFIGDSYLRGTGSTDGPDGGTGYNSIGNGWGKTLINLEGLSASKVMCIAGGGAGFNATGTNGGGVGLNYAGMIEKASSMMQADEKARVRYIIIMGGANDGTSITATGISNALDACRTNFPTVPVHVFTNLSTRSSSQKHDLSEGNAYAYNMIKNRCCLSGASFHETWKLGYCTTTLYNEDNVHCSSAGYITLARAMHAAIHGGIITPIALKDYCGYFDITPEAGVSIGSIKPYYDGDDYVIINSTTLTINTETLPISGNSPIPVATIPLPLAPRMTLQSVAIVYGSSFWTSGTYGLVPVDINGSGQIRIRRAFSADTTTSEANSRIKASAGLTGAGAQILVMLPPISYKLF